MAQVEVLMPKMGGSVFEATITKWLKKEGDKVEAEESIVEIATDKVDSEIPSHVSGTLLKCLYKEGDVVKVDKAVALIESDSDVVEVSKPKVERPVAEKKEIPPTASVEKLVSKHKELSTANSRFLSPLVKSIAMQEGVSADELETIAGTGVGGRITKKDIIDYLPGKGKDTRSPSVATVSSNSHVPSVSIGANDEIIEMDRMRRLIADHMIHSKHTSAHVTSFVEADVTNLVKWRDKVKDSFEKKEGEKLTFTPIFIEILSKVIREFPMVNVSVDGNKIIKHKNINIGMATALPSGNLIVPVIKNADALSLVGITKKVNDLALRARNNQLLPDEIQGGTYTMTNVGTFGNIMGTPIINQPQVAIMAVGSIKKKPAVIETEEGDVIGIRHFMYLSHTYDHRVVDGSLGGQFVKRVGDLLEQWDVRREI